MEEGCQNFEGTGPQTHHQETSSLPLLSDPTRSAPLPGPAPDPAPAPDKTEMGEPSAQPFTSAPSTSEPEEVLLYQVKYSVVRKTGIVCCCFFVYLLTMTRI